MACSSRLEQLGGGRRRRRGPGRGAVCAARVRPTRASILVRCVPTEVCDAAPRPCVRVCLEPRPEAERIACARSLCCTHSRGGGKGGCCICPRLHTETTRCRPGSASSFSSSPTMSSHVPIEQQNSDRASQQPAVAAAATPDLPAAAQGPGGGRSPSTPRSQAELAAAAAGAPGAPPSAAPAASASSGAVVGAPSLASQYGQHPAVSLARTGLEDAMQSLRESNNMLNFYRQQVIQAAQEKPQDPAVSL